MKRTKREITKRLRFNAEQGAQLDSFLQEHGIGFTKLIHILIQRELCRYWPLVHQTSEEQALSEPSKLWQSVPLKKRSLKNTVGRPIPSADPQLLLELGRIGNNINQIARSLNFLCLQQTEDIQKFSFVDCVDVLVTIQSDLHQYLPVLPKYFVSDQLAKNRKAKAIQRVMEDR
ncbi:plasmid mobilization relaxosome protein MobC [Acinetobacter sp. CIP 102136]|uniref:plasmid mobilization relaxosome protein MobC n=1 Tax=Acinetobacter sp. CIP 102136 TaxID=1144665 RepID=UPI0002CECA24|nr:plasmid mobilization relaxosome protein MobC [Acinetobacter sp. CIP 102136]ENX25594.1 hypothetical protein F893_00079 [Acinetobacter sp. CIP 102136]